VRILRGFDKIHVASFRTFCDFLKEVAKSAEGS